jgi:hypothetical protein
MGDMGRRRENSAMKGLDAVECCWIELDAVVDDFLWSRLWVRSQSSVASHTEGFVSLLGFSRQWIAACALLSKQPLLPARHPGLNQRPQLLDFLVVDLI